MKYLRLYESFNKNEIDEICREYGISYYTINPDGSININGGNVYIDDMGLSKIPINFNKVNGDFDCSDNHYPKNSKKHDFSISAL